MLLNYIAGHALQEPDKYACDLKISLSDLDSPRALNNLSDYVLLNQTGYLTIKRISPLGNTAVLNYPNEEVANSMAMLYKEQIFSVRSSVEDSDIPADELFYERPVEKIPSLLNSVLTGIDYKDFPITDESSLRSHLYFYIKGAGIKVFSELHNAYGRSDLEFEIGNKAYVLELKFHREGSVQKLLDDAKKQIIEKHYGERFLLSKKELVLTRMALVYSQDEKRFVAYDFV